MLSVALCVVAFLVFLLAAANQTVLSQPPADLIAWGLAALALASLVTGWGPPAPWRREP